MVVPDRTLNTLLKDVILKGVVVIFSSQSPTKNKQAAIQKMLEAGEFIANNGESMDQDSFDRLGADSIKLVAMQRDLSTRWGDLFSHPVTTYMSARELKAEANALLSEAKSASFQSKVNRAGHARRERAAQIAAGQTHSAPTLQALQDTVIAPTHLPANVVAPAALLPSASSPTDCSTAAGDDRAYIRLGELEMRIPLDSRTQIGFDGEVLTTRFRAGPIKSNESASGDHAVRAIKRTASVFTATGTARIVKVPQPDTSSSGPNQGHSEEVPTPCKFEWLEGPVVTALTDLEGGEPEVMDSGTDSNLSSD